MTTRVQNIRLLKQFFYSNSKIFRILANLMKQINKTFYLTIRNRDIKEYLEKRMILLWFLLNSSSICCILLNFCIFLNWNKAIKLTTKENYRPICFSPDRYALGLILDFYQISHHKLFLTTHLTDLSTEIGSVTEIIGKLAIFTIGLRNLIFFKPFSFWIGVYFWVSNMQNFKIVQKMWITRKTVSSDNLIWWC